MTNNNAGWWLFEAVTSLDPEKRKNFAVYAGSGFEGQEHFSNIHHSYDPEYVIRWLKGNK